MGTRDNIIELIENIEKDHNSFIIGIIKKGQNNEEEKLEIYTNLGDNPLDRLSKVLKDYKKISQPSKLKNEKNIIEIVEKKDVKE